MLTENNVNDLLSNWLKLNGYKIISTRKGTARGDDISAITPNGIKLFVECKGAISNRGNNLDCWRNAAMAIFGAIKETEHLRPNDLHAIAIPDTTEYRSMFNPIDGFFVKHSIIIFWVRSNGEIHFGGMAQSL